jgi:hypothetical protein
LLQKNSHLFYFGEVPAKFMKKQVELIKQEKTHMEKLAGEVLQGLPPRQKAKGIER